MLGALNWPHHRGTATGLALSAFGLSAFFFTVLSSVAFPDNTSSFLLVLAAGTFSLVFVAMFFMRVPHAAAYTALASSDEQPSLSRSDSNQLHRTKLGQSRHSADEPGEIFSWFNYSSLCEQLPSYSVQTMKLVIQTSHPLLCPSHLVLGMLRRNKTLESCSTLTHIEQIYRVWLCCRSQNSGSSL